MSKIELRPLEKDDIEAFVKDNQEAFKYGAVEEFGLRDEHYEDEEEGEIISSKTILASISQKGADTYRIYVDGEKMGGVIVVIDPFTQHNHLDILFVSPKCHSKGVGFAAWKQIEERYPDTKVWETCTPYFEKRNIHFYVNKCGFHIVEFINEKHRGNNPDMFDDDGMFVFEKTMKA